MSCENKKPWWNSKWGKDKICGITHSRLRPGCNKFGLSYAVTLKCGHSFYRKPLVMWIGKCGNVPTCPICRKSFKAISCHVLIYIGDIYTEFDFIKIE